MRTTTVVVGSPQWIKMWVNFYMIRAEKAFAHADNGSRDLDFAMQLGFSSLLEARYWADKKPWA